MLMIIFWQEASCILEHISCAIREDKIMKVLQVVGNKLKHSSFLGIKIVHLENPKNLQFNGKN